MAFKKLSQLTEKLTALVNGDYLTGINSEDSPVAGMILKWSLVKSTLKTYFDTLYLAITNKAAASDVATGSDDAKYVTSKAVHDGVVHHLRGLLSNPQALYTQRPQVFLMLTDAAITVTRIHLCGPDSTPGAEFAGDLKFADDMLTGGFANATVIQAVDTTSGAFTKTSSFTDATIPSGKYVYLLMDASPNADWKDIYLEVFYTRDAIT